MAQTDFTNEQANDSQPSVLDGTADTLRIEDNAFISDAEISRDGFDLILTLENGESLVIEDYFTGETSPTIISESGSALTPQLVNSFVQNNQFAEAGGANDASPVGAVKEITGDATVTRTDGSIETINLGTPIFEGDVIETGVDGAVNIVFIDETEFAVSEDARLAIDEYVFDPDTSEGTTNFSVLRGVFVFTSGVIGRDDPDDVEIETPVGSIGIRGTIIAGHIDPDGVNTEITVVEGAIVIRNAMGEMTLSNQFETVQLSGYEAEIINIGSIDSGQMNQKFGSVSGVSPSLFSAINDAGKEDSSGEESGTQGAPEASGDSDTDAPTQEGAQEGESSSVNTDPSKETVQTADGQTTAPGQEQNLTGLESKLAGNNLLGEPATQAGTGASQTPVRTTGTSGQTTTQAADDGASANSAYDSLDNAASPTNTIGTTITPITVASFPVGFDLNNDTALAGRGLNVAYMADAGIGFSIAGLGGDVDGDGINDFAFVGTNGNLHTYNSSTQSVTSFYFGGLIAGNVQQDVNISAGGDINGDGNADLILGTPQANAAGQTNSGQFALFTGEDNTENNSVINDTAADLTPGSLLGRDVALIGDFDADGYSDYSISLDELGGGAGGLYVYKSSGIGTPLGTSTMNTTDFDFVDGAAGENLGFSIYAGGDINRDGYDDIIVGTLNNVAYLVYGDDVNTVVGATITAPAGVTFFGKHVSGGGDFNRDGYDDFLLSSIGFFGEQVHLYSGNGLNEVTRFFHSQAGWEINQATIINDFNGDGRADIALSANNGTHSVITVIYGRASGLPTDFDLNFFDNPAAFNPEWGINFKWENTGNNIEIADIGDINADGLSDIAIGASDADYNFGGPDDGAIKIVYGQATPNVVTDNDLRDGDSAINTIGASSNGQALLGNEEDNIFRGFEFGQLSISGGGGDDTIVLRAAGVTHKTIDGGAGSDHMFLQGDGGVLDFSSAGAPGMTLSNIEEITLTGNNQDLIFDISDIFSLLQESHNSTLRITTTGTNNDLFLVKEGGDIGLQTANFTGEVGGTGDTISVDGFYEATLGGYTLLVDTNINVNLY